MPILTFATRRSTAALGLAALLVAAATPRGPAAAQTASSQVAATRPASVVVSGAGSQPAQRSATSAPSATSRPIAASTPVEPPPPVGPGAEALLAIGSANLKASRVADAVRALRAAAGLRPGDGRYAIKLAQALRQSGDRAAAIQALDDCLLLSPEDDEVAVALASEHFDGRDWRQVEAVLKARWSRLEGAGLALLTRAMHHQGRTREAEALLEQRLDRAMGERGETAWLLYAELALDGGNPGRAVERVERARVRRVQTPRLAFVAARAYLMMGRPLGSAEIREVEGGQVGRIADGWLPIEKVGEPSRFLCCPEESGLFEVTRALAGGLTLPETHLLHAKILAKASRPKDAWRVLSAQQQALIESKLPEALELLSDVSLSVGEIETFIRVAELRAEREPEKREELLFEAHRAAARRWAQRGDSEQHQKHLRAALEIRPKSAALMVELGDGLWESRETAEAQAWYRKALEADPATPERLRLFERLSMVAASRPGEER